MLPFILCLFVTASKADPRTRFGETAVNVTATVGDTAVLPCAVSDLGDSKVVWVDQFSTLLSFEDRIIIDDLRMSVERPFPKDWNLHIRNVRFSDSGEYQCQVSTSPVTVTSVFLTVIDTGPRFGETAVNVTATVGDTAVLPCAVSDLGDYSVVWLNQLHKLLTYMDRRIINDLRISVERPFPKDWNLHIQDIRLSDSGEYQCQVNTSPVTVTSVFLTVIEPKPRFLETSRNVTATAGTTAVLPCAISDLNDHQVLWINQHRLLLTYMESRMADDRRISLERPYLKDWNLRIRDVRLSDSGEYLCQVNTSPLMKTSVFLTVIEAGQDEVTSRRPRYDGHDVMDGSVSSNATWASGQGSVKLLATAHPLLLSAALVNWVCWF